MPRSPAARQKTEAPAIPPPGPVKAENGRPSKTGPLGTTGKRTVLCENRQSVGFPKREGPPAKAGRG